MKKLALALSLTALFSTSSFAADIEEFDLDCGDYMGLPVKISVRKSSGRFALEATYQGPSMSLYGTFLRGSETNDFKGSSEVLNGISVYNFTSLESAFRGLVMERPQKIGQKIDVAHLVAKTEDQTSGYEFNCKVKAPKK
jgi:hypothetical protein